MNKNEEKQKILGDFYVSMNCTDKNKFIDAINGFINSCPTFKPFIDKKNFTRNDSRIFKYIENNNLRLLRREFFVDKLDNELADRYICGNRIEIAIDDNGVKHVIVARINSRNAYELSNKLGIETIRLIYKKFVYDVESLATIIRSCKEIKSFFETLTYPCYFINEKLNEKEIYIIHNANFHIEDLMLDYKLSCYCLLNNNDVRLVHDKTNMKCTNMEFIKVVFNEKNIINEDMFVHLVSDAFNKKVSMINEQMINIMNNINSF